MISLGFYGKTPCFDSVFKKVDEIPKLCVELAKTIHKLEMFQGSYENTQLVQGRKVIVLKAWVDARLMDIVSQNAIPRLNKGLTAWHIHAFGCGYNQLFDTDRNRIPQGLYLQYFKDVDMCSPTILETTYQQVMVQLAVNWNAIETDKMPRELLPKNPEGYVFFEKTKDLLIEEDVLVRCIIEKLSLKETVMCEEFMLEGKRYIYLGIKESALENVAALLGFYNLSTNKLRENG